MSASCGKILISTSQRGISTAHSGYCSGCELWNFRSLERKFHPWKLRVWQPFSRQSAPTTTWRAGTTVSIARHVPASWTWLLSCTRRRRSLWFSLQCARERRAFVPVSAPDVPQCAGLSAGVLAWHRYKARELTTSQMLGRCAHLTGPAQRWIVPNIWHWRCGAESKWAYFFSYFALCYRCSRTPHTNCGASPSFFIPH